jgi:hypothetical protein
VDWAHGRVARSADDIVLGAGGTPAACHPFVHQVGVIRRRVQLAHAPRAYDLDVRLPYAENG